MNAVSPIEGMEPERFRSVMLANVEGLACRSRCRSSDDCPRAGGRFYLVGSRQARSSGGLFRHCTSKSAIDGMTRALGCEWGKYGITVNALPHRIPFAGHCLDVSSDNENANEVARGFGARA